MTYDPDSLGSDNESEESWEIQEDGGDWSSIEDLSDLSEVDAEESSD
jgi:hypothetical protein